MRISHTNLLIALVFAVTAVGTPVAATGDTPQPEQSILVGIQGVDGSGQTAEVAPDQSLEWHRTDAASYHGLEQLNETHVLAAFAVDSEDCGEYEPPCGRTGFRVIERESDQITREWTFPVRTVPDSEVHDVERLPSGEVVVADMDRERIMTVSGNGSVTWEWRASQHYQAPDDPTTVDWLHINDVDHIGEGKFLVSVRNVNQLLIVERGAGVVDVINEDGNTSVLRAQHNPQWLGDGRVLVADSENGRVVELAEQNGTWRPVWGVDSAAGESFSWPRDADRQPDGTTLITDSRNHRVVLVDEGGDTRAVWETPKLPYEADFSGTQESVGGPTLTGTVADPGDPGGVTAPFRLALVAVHHSVGAPDWLQWWHFAALGLAIVVRAGGDVLSWRRQS